MTSILRVWEKNQYGAREWAKQEAISILEEHQPDPLDSTLSNELTKIIASVENEK